VTAETLFNTEKVRGHADSRCHHSEPIACMTKLEGEREKMEIEKSFF